MAKRRSKRAMTSVSQKPIALRSTAEKIRVITKNVITFAILFVVSYILFRVIGAGFFKELFFLLLLIFGFIVLAFLIAWLVLIMIKPKAK